MATQRRPVFLGVSKAQRKAIDAALQRVGLEGKSGYKLGSLSGGERQRVLFAQAMLPEPALLVLDEPMTGLDVKGHDILEREIVSFARAGGTVVWINHDILKVHAVADSLTYIDQRVLLDGPPAQALASEPALQLYPGFDKLEAAKAR
jgi:zinc transport system ATP-binding protein